MMVATAVEGWEGEAHCRAGEEGSPAQLEPLRSSSVVREGTGCARRPTKGPRV